MPQSSTSLLTVAQLRAVPATEGDVGPPALGEHAAQFALRVAVRRVQVDSAAEYLGFVPAAFRPHLPLCVGHPGDQAGRYLGQEHRMQELGIRLARIRIVAHAADELRARKNHRAGLNADGIGNGSLQLSA